MYSEFAQPLKQTNIPNKFLEQLYNTFFHSKDILGGPVIYLGEYVPGSSCKGLEGKSRCV